MTRDGLSHAVGRGTFGGDVGLDEVQLALHGANVLLKPDTAPERCLESPHHIVIEAQVGTFRIRESTAAATSTHPLTKGGGLEGKADRAGGQCIRAQHGAQPSTRRRSLERRAERGSSAGAATGEATLALAVEAARVAELEAAADHETLLALRRRLWRWLAWHKLSKEVAREIGAVERSRAVHIDGVDNVQKGGRVGEGAHREHLLHLRLLLHAREHVHL